MALYVQGSKLLQIFVKSDWLYALVVTQCCIAADYICRLEALYCTQVQLPSASPMLGTGTAVSDHCATLQQLLLACLQSTHDAEMVSTHDSEMVSGNAYVVLGRLPSADGKAPNS